MTQTHLKYIYISGTENEIKAGPATSKVKDIKHRSEVEADFVWMLGEKKLPVEEQHDNRTTTRGGGRFFVGDVKQRPEIHLLGDSCSEQRTGLGGLSGASLSFQDSMAEAILWTPIGCLCICSEKSLGGGPISSQHLMPLGCKLSMWAVCTDFEAWKGRGLKLSWRVEG